jgi:hypothetical protein
LQHSAIQSGEEKSVFRFSGSAIAVFGQAGELTAGYGATRTSHVRLPESSRRDWILLGATFAVVVVVLIIFMWAQLQA